MPTSPTPRLHLPAQAANIKPSPTLAGIKIQAKAQMTQLAVSMLKRKMAPNTKKIVPGMYKAASPFRESGQASPGKKKANEITKNINGQAFAKEIPGIRSMQMKRAPSSTRPIPAISDPRFVSFIWFSFHFSSHIIEQI
jgi:hypothetical protein